jgi:phosphate/sulfate permease
MIPVLGELSLAFADVGHEIARFFDGVAGLSGAHVGLLILCLALAFAFEFVNGFHDTANAVATVIYTNSLKPWPAVILAGVCNFLGVFIGGTVVAMAIVKLIPPDLIVTSDLNTTVAFIFSMLMSALIWNLGTWYFGIPSSSSHTLIGSILGIGMGHAYITTGSIIKGVNWGKAGDVGLALLISPAVGFTLGALVLLIFKLFFKNPKLHDKPSTEVPPPWSVRATLIATCSGVSFAHGSNDGQKGVGLVMLVLIALLPAQFALKPSSNGAEIQAMLQPTKKLAALLDESYIASLKAKPQITTSITIIDKAQASVQTESPDLAKIAQVQNNILGIEKNLSELSKRNSPDGRTSLAIRNHIFLLDKALSDIKKSGSAMVRTSQWKEVESIRKKAVALTDYAPVMVLLLVALFLGLGTMIGWKRVVVTIGEKIGNGYLTYCQGAAAQIVDRLWLAFPSAPHTSCLRELQGPWSPINQAFNLRQLKKFYLLGF